MMINGELGQMEKRDFWMKKYLGTFCRNNFCFLLKGKNKREWDNTWAVRRELRICEPEGRGGRRGQIRAVRRELRICEPANRHNQVPPHLLELMVIFVYQ